MNFYIPNNNQLGEDVLPELNPNEIVAPNQTQALEPLQAATNTPSSTVGGSAVVVIGGLFLLYLFLRSE